MTDFSGSSVFTQDEIAERAQGNITGLVITIIDYLRDHDLSADDWVRSTGERFAVGWQDLDDATSIMREMALNMASSGAQVLSLTGNDREAEAIIGPWPSTEELEFFNAKREDIDVFADTFKPIAAHLGYQFQRQREGERMRLRISKASNS